MQRSPIMQMFSGERGHEDQIKCSKEYMRLLEIAIGKEAAIKKRLAAMPDILKIYNETDDAIGEMHSKGADEYYSEGFRFGFVMALDVLGVLKIEE